MKIEVSIGEIIDKYTILCIKLEKVKDKNKIKFVKKEHEYLNNIIKNFNISEKFISDLLKINKTLWNIEDEIRKKEKKEEFNKEFIELARSVYKTNDIRAEIKLKINKLTGSEFCEIKELP